jgi:ribosome biogenesis GTPase
MSNRRLSKQQKQRQAAIQQKRRQQATKPTTEDLSQLDERAQNGLVISHHGKHFIVENQAQELIICNKRQNLGTIVTGDRVVWHATNKTQGVVTACHPRKGLIERAAARNQIKPLAANVDQLIIVCAVTPAPQSTTIDRYLVLAHLNSLTPIVVFNKWDLIIDSKKDDLAKLMQIYIDIGYTTLTTSTKSDPDCSLLLKELSGHTNILVGQSGVGKSTLLNHIIPDADAQIGAISEAKGLGKHTTTVTKLYHLASGGDLIDSPGIRQFQLANIDSKQLLNCFPELEKMSHNCKFRNCTHINEKGCALIEAIAQGLISQQRFESYLTLLQEYDTQKPY